EEVHDYFVKPTETEVLVGKIRSKLAQRSPDQSRIRQRLTQVIRANRESVVENWLQAVQKDSEISSIPVPDSERKEHVPLLLEVATDVAEGKELTADNRSEEHTSELQSPDHLNTFPYTTLFRSPDQSRIRQRLTQVIRANRESVVENWLQAVQKDSEISSIPVPDSERKEHVPLLLEVATDVAEGKELTADN